jgi:hypothetical protein
VSKQATESLTSSSEREIDRREVASEIEIDIDRLDHHFTLCRMRCLFAFLFSTRPSYRRLRCFSGRGGSSELTSKMLPVLFERVAGWGGTALSGFGEGARARVCVRVCGSWTEGGVGCALSQFGVSPKPMARVPAMKDVPTITWS